MKELHVASKPLLELLFESIGVNLLVVKTTLTIERDAARRIALTLHEFELQEMHNHLEELLKD